MNKQISSVVYRMYFTDEADPTYVLEEYVTTVQLRVPGVGETVLLGRGKEPWVVCGAPVTEFERSDGVVTQTDHVKVVTLREAARRTADASYRRRLAGVVLGGEPRSGKTPATPVTELDAFGEDERSWCAMFTVEGDQCGNAPVPGSDKCAGHIACATDEAH